MTFTESLIKDKNGLCLEAATRSELNRMDLKVCN